ncbi:hypothetical protein NPIL_596381 [Nephila pilipes]|uniref:Uncharacterized protein n=1 Tax=Nephila pilipes TaxID=299642 RepID=A0A8X6NLP0_NEPPI|nr:hypothetical protein NPIL_596381 [Nephila pilipes]
MAIAFLSEIMMYLISFFVVDYSMPCFGEKIVCVFMNEMIKLFSKWYYGNEIELHSMAIPVQISLSLEHGNGKNGIPVVYSFMIFKMCEGLDIEVQLAPIEKRVTWGKKIKKSTKCIPTVRSENVFEICNALKLPVKLKRTEELDAQVQIKTKISSRSKASSVVYSVAIYKICLALGLSAQLNEKA